jgi:hypothetical protein
MLCTSGGLMLGPRLRLLPEGQTQAWPPVQVADPVHADKAPAGRLPFPLASFVGRSAEIEQAAGLLASNRLLTITGGGGCGKTQLAIELARRVQGQFAGGAWFVDLEPVPADGHVMTEIAAALGVEEPERGRTANSVRCANGISAQGCDGPRRRGSCKS